MEASYLLLVSSLTQVISAIMTVFKTRLIAMMTNATDCPRTFEVNSSDLNFEQIGIYSVLPVAEYSVATSTPCSP